MRSNLGKTLVIAGAISFVVAAGCASPKQPTPDSNPASGSPSKNASHTDDFRLADMLAELPATAYQPGALPAGVAPQFTLYAGDLSQASALVGIDRPTDTSEAPTWVAQLNGASVTDGQPPAVFVPLDVPLATSSPAETVQEDLGWSVVDVDRFVSFEIVGYASTTIASGTFQEGTLASLPEVSTGIRSAGDGADATENLRNGTPARPHGVPLRMAVNEGQLIASIYTQVVQDWLSGRGKSLADEPVLAEMASLLDDADAYSALIATPATFATLPSSDVEALGLTRDALPSFDAYAIGWSLGQGRPSLTVLYHPTQDVKSTREKIADRWSESTLNGDAISDLVDVGRVRISGSLVEVNLTPAEDQGAQSVFFMQDSQDLPFVSS